MDNIVAENIHITRPVLTPYYVSDTENILLAFLLLLAVEEEKRCLRMRATLEDIITCFFFCLTCYKHRRPAS